MRISNSELLHTAQNPYLQFREWDALRKGLRGCDEVQLVLKLFYFLSHCQFICRYLCILGKLLVLFNGIFKPVSDCRGKYCQLYSWVYRYVLINNTIITIVIIYIILTVIIIIIILKIVIFIIIIIIKIILYCNCCHNYHNNNYYFYCYYYTKWYYYYYLFILSELLLLLVSLFLSLLLLFYFEFISILVVVRLEPVLPVMRDKSLVFSRTLYFFCSQNLKRKLLLMIS